MNIIRTLDIQWAGVARRWRRNSCAGCYGSSSIHVEATFAAERQKTCRMMNWKNDGFRKGSGIVARLDWQANGSRGCIRRNDSRASEGQQARVTNRQRRRFPAMADSPTHRPMQNPDPNLLLSPKPKAIFTEIGNNLEPALCFLARQNRFGFCIK